MDLEQDRETPESRDVPTGTTDDQEGRMPLFLVRHHFDTPLRESGEGVDQLIEVSREFGIEWVRSYYDERGTSAVCVYHASNAEVLEEHALCLGLPVDEIISVVELTPTRG